MLLVADSWISPSIRVADARIASNVSSSKISVSLISLSVKLNLTSIGKTGSLLLIKKIVNILLTNVELHSAQKEHLQWYAATPRDVHLVFTEAFFIVLFYFSIRQFDCRWYAEVICCSIPVRSCRQGHTPLTNSLPWSFIWTSKQPWQHISS